MLEIQSNVSLKDFTTMRIGGSARYLTKINSEDELLEALEFAYKNILKTIVLGDGSNIIFSDNGFDGLVLINQIKGLEINDNVITASTGENWDNLVKISVEKGLSGIETLSLIPGTVGGAPVNNIGAYGQEVKDTIKSIRAYDTYQKKFVELNNEQCDFRYRNSIFKSTEYGRYIITKVVFRLHKYKPDDYIIPKYKSLDEELSKKKKSSIADVRKAVIEIRKRKLPNPKLIANTGSFFKNPIVSRAKAEDFIKLNPLAPTYPANNGIKIAAAWLIENSGLKGYKNKGIRISDKQALVLINDSSSSFNDLKGVYTYIIDSVKDKFGVILEIEPEIII